jgi:tetratricopeptide (TPR) repeat protein
MSLEKPRTLLEQLVADGRRTWPELEDQFARHAREMAAESGERLAAISWRQLQRIAAGEVGSPRPAAARVLQRQFGKSIEELLGPPDLAKPAMAAAVPEQQRVVSEQGAGDTNAELLRQLRTTEFDTLAQEIVSWAEQAPLDMGRRELLLKLGSALSLAAARSILEIGRTSGEGQEGLGHSIRHARAALDDAVEVLVRRRRQGDMLGPYIALQTALAQQHAISSLLSTASGSLRVQALNTYAEVTQCIGWLLFNLGDYRRASYYYDEARTAAHDAENNDLVAYVLCAMSHLATWVGRPRVGIDHAAAAKVWAQQSRNPFAMSYAADVAARAYAADHQLGSCLAALDQEEAAVAHLPGDSPVPNWWYFFDESFYLGTRSECLLRLGRTDAAAEVAQQALICTDRSNTHNYVLTLSLLGEACARQGNFQEAATLIGDIAELTQAGRSYRVAERIEQLRGALAPWRHTSEFNELDDKLVRYGLASRASSSTNNV